MLKGCWILKNIKGIEVKLYTLQYVDIIKNKKTNEEYRRGEWKLFRENEMPPLVDNDPNYAFINIVDNKLMTVEEIGREILAGVIVK